MYINSIINIKQIFLFIYMTIESIKINKLGNFIKDHTKN
jgi:hypothetical protein